MWNNIYTKISGRNIIMKNKNETSTTLTLLRKVRHNSENYFVGEATAFKLWNTNSEFPIFFEPS